MVLLIYGSDERLFGMSENVDKKPQVNGFAKYKNTLMIFISLILFAYASLISVVPACMTNSFDIDKFEQKVFEATSLVTTLDTIEFKVAPNFKTTIIAKNLSLKYIDYQPLFDARQIKIETTYPALFGKSFDIKKIDFKGVKYADQILPTGENKIAFLPGAFNSEVFGTKSITVTPGPAKIKDLKVTYVTPKTYKEKSYREKSFSRDEVALFLKSFDYSHVKIK